uniref:Vacuolar iron transporter n=1 Tax=Anthurium amnicola TaxID=1678845 RepID=A0A1D1XGA2_9ARAE
MALGDLKLTADGIADPRAPQELDYSQRAQWLRAAVLGANDGLVSTASMMMGVSAVKTDVKSMVLTGFAALVAGACSMAIGEFVSVYSQVDVEVAQMKRDRRKQEGGDGEVEGLGREEDLPSPVQAAVASGVAFAVGAMVPLLAAGFVRSYHVRLGVVSAAVTLALVVFGVAGARLGGVPVGRSASRVLVGGWMAMAVTYGLMKLVGGTGGF